MDPPDSVGRNRLVLVVLVVFDFTQIVRILYDQLITAVPDRVVVDVTLSAVVVSAQM